MGCCFSASTPVSEETQERPKYSWETREKLDPKDYTFRGLKDEVVGRMPGTVNGQQFIIDQCENCDIYVFDHAAAVTIDDCVNCRIFLGPVKTSIFIRDCTDCKLIASCQQFRTRDCRKIDVFLHCTTQPIIESTTGIKFGCFQYFYPEIESHFQGAGLSVYNNNWSNIHDFTEVPDHRNYSYLSEDVNIEDYVPVATTEPFSTVQVSTEKDRSAVPVTLGNRRKQFDESCLVVFFNDGMNHERAHNFILQMASRHPSNVLVQTKELPLKPDDAQRVFNSNAYASAVQQGPVTGLEYNGERVIENCQQCAMSISQGSIGLVFVSHSSSQAVQEIENFYNFADMQFAV